ncbi:MAG: SGNH/GDSL hydrolase family protein, partial [Planctomycetota bacterium]|nr:SGNH/GDSL hydrolase family protein [Planctomycetota bacterium]
MISCPLILSLFALSVEQDYRWVDAHELIVEGQGWENLESPFDRLPSKSKGVVRDPVWRLSRDSSGIAVRFSTDSSSIGCRWALIDSSLALPHMPATGVSGVDLYVRDDEGEWRWLACPRPNNQNMTATLISGLPVGSREFMLYLPLYNGVSSLEIGVEKDATLRPGSERPKGKTRPLVFYGTSITQGGCASRPGMTHVALLGRKMDIPVINLGFSGNGTMDISMADLLVEIDAEIYIIDCLPNMNGNEVRDRVVPFVERIREKRPRVPILLVEDRTFSNSFLRPKSQNRHKSSRAALREGFSKLSRDGVENLYYLEGKELLLNEDTVDGSHPT